MVRSVAISWGAITIPSLLSSRFPANSGHLSRFRHHHCSPLGQGYKPHQKYFPKLAEKFRRNFKPLPDSSGFRVVIFSCRKSMSTSRKRPDASRGKAPARDQSDAPDVPRFRDAKAAENYTKSLPRKFASTKFMCKPTLISLGVLEGFTKLFRNIGWENLLNLLTHIYELPTREFLADSGYDSEKKKTAFQLLGDRRYIDFAVINDILGLPSSNTSTIFDVLLAEFNHKTFWTEITGGIFSCAGRDKATSIIHPCLRIAHRI
ncbi:unnamed protein product [Lactuca saligna]|uniref:Arabidopsis retrotransposon Orf1 C-terminal domain-containing protein n=1 Tax=Lactuca saligna TaxID=75948 RepID=A0AA35Z2E4_LACSI|nr:unnamed protein product [Lactuca saligna]